MTCNTQLFTLYLAAEMHCSGNSCLNAMMCTTCIIDNTDFAHFKSPRQMILLRVKFVDVNKKRVPLIFELCLKNFQG